MAKEENTASNLGEELLENELDDSEQPENEEVNSSNSPSYISVFLGCLMLIAIIGGIVIYHCFDVTTEAGKTYVDMLNFLCAVVFCIAGAIFTYVEREVFKKLLYGACLALRLLLQHTTEHYAENRDKSLEEHQRSVESEDAKTSDTESPVGVETEISNVSDQLIKPEPSMIDEDSLPSCSVSEYDSDGGREMDSSELSARLERMSKYLSFLNSTWTPDKAADHSREQQKVAIKLRDEYIKMTGLLQSSIEIRRRKGMSYQMVPAEEGKSEQGKSVQQ